LKAAGDYNSHVDKYDFKSENVIELLKQLKLKFEDDQLAGTKAETNAVNAYDLAKQARDDAISAATKSKEKKEKELADTESAIADAEATKKNTEDDLAADSKSLADTEDSCALNVDCGARSRARSRDNKIADHLQEHSSCSRTNSRQLASSLGDEINAVHSARTMNAAASRRPGPAGRKLLAAVRQCGAAQRWLRRLWAGPMQALRLLLHEGMRERARVPVLPLVRVR